MSDKFSLYQTDGLWGIIENASDEKQTSIKSYFGSDLIIKRLNEQAEQIDQLKQQLAEKDCRIEELEGQFAYECECNKQLVELQKQLEKKQNEIDEINKEFVQSVKDWKTLCAEKDKEIELLKHLGNHEITVEMFKENTKLIIEKRQFAISELEKVKKLTENLLEKFCNSWEYNQKYMRGHRHIEYYDLIQGIDNQIKELKGEKK